MKSIFIILIVLNSFFAFGQSNSENIIKIMKSGDGLSIETAYKVHEIKEEYEVLSYLKLKLIMQKLIVRNGVFYDAMKTNHKTIYFKIIPKTK